jgi:hypothetical protein
MTKSNSVIVKITNLSVLHRYLHHEYQLIASKLQSRAVFILAPSNSGAGGKTTLGREKNDLLGKNDFVYLFGANRQLLGGNPPQKQV